MKYRTSHLAVVVTVLALSGVLRAAAPRLESQSTVPDTPKVADEATKDVRYDPNAPKVSAPRVASSETAPTAIKPEEADALHLSPYIVRDLPDRTFNSANEAMAQRRRLQSHAMYKVDLNRTVRAEFLSAPEPGGNGRANFPLFRLTW